MVKDSRDMRLQTSSLDAVFLLIIFNGYINLKQQKAIGVL